MFEAKELFAELTEKNADKPDSLTFLVRYYSKHVPRGDVFVYDFSTNRITGEKEEKFTGAM